MMTLPDHFDELLSRIEPSKDRLRLAKELPAQIRDYLKETGTITTVDPHSRLAGSYARDTAIGDIKDVDIIVLIDLEYKKGEPEKVLDELHVALQGLPEALDDVGQVEPLLRYQRRSIHVRFEDRDFDIDIVPAVALDGLDQPLWIPDRDWSKWVKTDPLGYGEYLSELNKKHGCKVVPLIKMLKRWRDARMIYRRPKSYWLECLVVRHISEGWVTTDGKSYAELFADLLASIESRFLKIFQDEDTTPPEIPDPMLSNNVAWNWERAEFETFMRRVQESRRLTERALAAEHETDAVELWQRVFNREDEEVFPATVDNTLHAISRAAKAGRPLRITTSGIVLLKPSAETPSWPSPAHRFYGDA
jgi:hypothetical protein